MPISNASALEVAEDKVDGRGLIEFGKAVNSSLLKLIGHALANVESKVQIELCQIDVYTCTPWTSWTTCTAERHGKFGFQTRSRTCGHKSAKDCIKSGNVTVENDSRLCEGWCRYDYNMTRHNFCLKINTTGVTQPDAEKQCQQEGSHLINVDTQKRWSDFTEILKTVGGGVWVDGNRTKPGGSWNFISGTDPALNGIYNWYTGEPSNTSDQLCKASGPRSQTRYFFDDGCYHKYSFICEIRKA